MKSLRFTILTLLLGCCLAVGEKEDSPRFLSHLLGYIALDYFGAVENPGIVTNAFEYAEMVEFVDSALKEAAAIPEVSHDGEFNSVLRELKELIQEKAAPDRVEAIARWLEARVVQLCGVNAVPSKWPSLARGEKKYAENCASCHGITGHGDGPAGGSLEPRPANFHDGARMGDMTPFNIFNAIRIGVPGTGMAAFALNDEQTWDLVFYVASLRHRSLIATHREKPSIPLSDLAEKSDHDLLKQISQDPSQRMGQISTARTYQAPESDASQFVDIALDHLDHAAAAFDQKNWDRAEKFALAAYLDGVELFEPSLRAKDPGFVLELEQAMAAVRSVIATHGTREALNQALKVSRGALEKSRELLRAFSPSPIATSLLSAGIVLREALEAVLILVALLGVIRSANVSIAATSVHLGWILAVASGIALWFFSGWVVSMSGMQRELVEGFVTLIAVAVLLYFGFWLHRKTEIGRWRSYLEQIAVQLTDGKKLFGLFGVAFMAVFREAFETVLFLRVLCLEAGAANKSWIGIGVVMALVAVSVTTVIALRLSRRLPVRQIFLLSSSLLIILAVTLMGKGIHAFQETGFVGMTAFPLSMRFEWLGVYSTWESLLPQFLIILLVVAVWSYERWQSLPRMQVPQS